MIDSLDEAIAVFSSAGVITISNAAYTSLWGIDPSATLAQTAAIEATRLWQSRTAPTPVWGDLRDFIADTGERADWCETVSLTDGRILQCRFQPIAGGATLVGFTHLAEGAESVRNAARRAPETKAALASARG